jgi:hypothetical protein
MKWGKPRPCIPSRFLMEMKGDTERAKRAAEAAKAMFGAALPHRGAESGGQSEDAAGTPKKKSRSKSAAKEPAKKRALTRR